MCLLTIIRHSSWFGCEFYLLAFIVHSLLSLPTLLWVYDIFCSMFCGFSLDLTGIYRCMTAFLFSDYSTLCLGATVYWDSLPLFRLDSLPKFWCEKLAKINFFTFIKKRKETSECKKTYVGMWVGSHPKSWKNLFYFNFIVKGYWDSFPLFGLLYTLLPHCRVLEGTWGW
jgi:hypothetical protein